MNKKRYVEVERDGYLTVLPCNKKWRITDNSKVLTLSDILEAEFPDARERIAVAITDPDVEGMNGGQVADKILNLLKGGE